MTGYGKAEIFFGEDKIDIELRSINGKSADITLKSALIPKSKDAEIRQLLSTQLLRGSIDLYVSMEGYRMLERPINKALFKEYYREIEDLRREFPDFGPQENLLSAILRIPEVMECKHSELSGEQWAAILEGVNIAIKELHLFREKEGERLWNDMRKRVEIIELFIYKVEELEESRILAVKERLLSKLHEFAPAGQVDQNRFEQELIYYLEKLDITEERVRLRQHCAFFKQTALEENAQGRKLSFIAQEMGREINTICSKANHAAIQQWGVMMKDELEKIKEQLLNIL